MSLAENQLTEGFAPKDRCTSDRLILAYAVPVLFFCFMFCISRVGLGFIPVIAELGWGAAFMLLCVFIAQKPNLYLSLARRNAIVLLGPLFAICSTFWSLIPGLSIYSASLLFLNVLVGFMLADRLGTQKTITYVFCYGLIIQCLSLLLILLKHPTAFSDIGEARGLYMHKNSLSMNSGLVYFTGLLLIAAGWRRYIALTGIVIALINLVLSRSGTGMILIAFTTGVITLCFIAKAGRTLSSPFAGLLLIGVCAVGFTIYVTDFNVADSVLNALGKDTTLTGRTVLWDQAFKSFAEHPWLGVGYNTFWSSPQTAAPAIWVETGQFVSSFHNVYIDRLVDVGAIGLSLFVAALMLLFYRSARLLLRDPSPLAPWPATFITYVSVLGLSEYPIFLNTDFQLLVSFVAGVTSGVCMKTANVRKVAISRASAIQS